MVELRINRYQPGLLIFGGVLVECSPQRLSCLGSRLRFERALNLCGQATKGVWGMSWHQEALKGVEVCEKLGGADKRALIPGFPNWRMLNS